MEKIKVNDEEKFNYWESINNYEKVAISAYIQLQIARKTLECVFVDCRREELHYEELERKEN